MATKKASTTKKTSTSRKTVSTRTSTKAAPVTVTSRQTSSGSFSSNIRQFAFWRTIAAELIGTFLLASTVIVGQGQPLYILFALVGIVLLIGTISGAYVNPAVTVGAWVTGRINWMRAVGYIIAQFAGAALAWWALSGFISGSDSANAAAYGGQATELFKAASLTSGKEWFVFFSELLGTAILGFAVANALRKNQERLTSAFTVGLGIFIALMITYIATSYVAASTIINPAIAVALSALTFNNWWSIGVYVLAPVLGGIIGFLLNDFLKGRETN